MKCKLIVLEQPIIVSNEEIRIDDSWIYICPTSGVDFGDSGVPIVKNTALGADWFDRLHDKKNYFRVVAGIPKLPSIDYNDLEEKFGIVDMEKILSKDIDDNKLNNMTGKFEYMFGFEKGFKASQSINGKEFNLSQEEMFQLLLDYVEYYKPHNEARGVTIERFIKTLQQPKIFDIEIETEWVQSQVDAPDGHIYEPKITNNSIKIL